MSVQKRTKVQRNPTRSSKPPTHQYCFDREHSFYRPCKACNQALLSCHPADFTVNIFTAPTTALSFNRCGNRQVTRVTCCLFRTNMFILVVIIFNKSKSPHAWLMFSHQTGFFILLGWWLFPPPCLVFSQLEIIQLVKRFCAALAVQIMKKKLRCSSFSCSFDRTSS